MHFRAGSVFEGESSNVLAIFESRDAKLVGFKRGLRFSRLGGLRNGRLHLGDVAARIASRAEPSDERHEGSIAEAARLLAILACAQLEFGLIAEPLILDFLRRRTAADVCTGTGKVLLLCLRCGGASRAVGHHLAASGLFTVGGVEQGLEPSEVVSASAARITVGVRGSGQVILQLLSLGDDGRSRIVAQQREELLGARIIGLDLRRPKQLGRRTARRDEAAPLRTSVDAEARAAANTQKIICTTQPRSGRGAEGKHSYHLVITSSLFLSVTGSIEYEAIGYHQKLGHDRCDLLSHSGLFFLLVFVS
jgi:hypothetical protein